MEQKSGFGGVDPLESFVAEWGAGWREEMEGVLGVEGVGEISRKKKRLLVELFFLGGGIRKGKVHTHKYSHSHIKTPFSFPPHLPHLPHFFHSHFHTPPPTSETSPTLPLLL